MSKGVQISGTYQKGCFTLTAVIGDTDFTCISVHSCSLAKCAEYLDKALKDAQE